MGLDAPGEIEAMVKLMKPTAAILTSLDQAHMDNFQDDYRVLGKEKFTIFSTIEDKSRCFYQGDVEIYKDLATKKFPFGFDETNNYVITDVKNLNDKTTFKVNERSYECNLLGNHQASNAAGVIALLRTLGIHDELINKGLKDVTLTSMRTEMMKHKSALILFDAYKSSPKKLTGHLRTLWPLRHITTPLCSVGRHVPIRPRH